MDIETEREGSDSEVYVAAYETRPGRTVFIEETNPGGWIASDITLDIER